MWWCLLEVREANIVPLEIWTFQISQSHKLSHPLHRLSKPRKRWNTNWVYGPSININTEIQIPKSLPRFSFHLWRNVEAQSHDLSTLICYYRSFKIPNNEARAFCLLHSKYRQFPMCLLLCYSSTSILKIQPRTKMKIVAVLPFCQQNYPLPSQRLGESLAIKV